MTLAQVVDGFGGLAATDPDEFNQEETEDVVEEVPLRAIVGGEVSELNPSDRRGAVDA
eukprot:CAMPEP_0195519982 /NCGR_PEP_ID=MMETSP0794_2-20130614/15878_1 /TAXON_ID=515487 /ORGANISM="Stephanopyxis turris, Strain CCMP 815" /LENGTH=57 /DNA_ID=CAMNT_0040649243 /DNA_START=41 /DNA_END=212 /DNA_ORIENTATION=-